MADQAAPLHLAKVLPSARPAPDSNRIQTVLIQADQAVISGKYGEARRLYRGLIQEQKEAEEYAGTALWRLATTQLYEGAHYEAALTLDALASEAARFGDPTMELKASFEGAVLWQKVKRQDMAGRNLERVKSLLKSPVISGDDKQAIARRIVG